MMVLGMGGRYGVRLQQVLCGGLRHAVQHGRQPSISSCLWKEDVGALVQTKCCEETLKKLGLRLVPKSNLDLDLGHGSMVRCYHAIQSTTSGLHLSSCSSSPAHPTPPPPTPPPRYYHKEGWITSDGLGPSPPPSASTAAAKRLFVSSASMVRSSSKQTVEEVSSSSPPESSSSPPPPLPPLLSPSSPSSPHSPPSPPSPSQQQLPHSEDHVRAAFAYCAEQVRKFDYENYLCALHLPPSLRAVVFGLRAFNVEVATAVDSSSAIGSRRPSGGGDAAHHALASMRLLWWNENLRNVLAGKRVDHPVMVAMAAIFAETRLSRHWFTRICEARQKDLEADGPPRTIGQLEEYAESTASALLYLMLEAAGVRTTAADHAASHIGKAMCLSLLLRSTPYHSRRRRTYIPVDVAAKHGISQEEIYRGQVSDSMADAVLEVASSAKLHLDKARSLRSSLPEASLPLMLPAVPVSLFLSSLEKQNFNIFENSLNRGLCGGIMPLRVQIQLMWNAFRGTY